MEKDKVKRGGKREGSGRKATGRSSASYTVTLKPDEKEQLCEEYGNLTKALKTLLK